MKRKARIPNIWPACRAALPALVRAQKAQKKVARVNFDWENLGDVIAKVDEELGETKQAIQKLDATLA